MRFVVPVVLALTGCVLPQVVPEAQNTEFVAKGEVRAHARSASFDSVRVRSPQMNITKRTDGSWGGTFDGRAIDVSVEGDNIRGANMTLTRSDSTKDKLVITGQFEGRIYRFELDANQALVRTPNTSITYPGRVISERQTSYGPGGDLVLIGEAGAESPPWPQFAFAMMAAFF